MQRLKIFALAVALMILGVLPGFAMKRAGNFPFVLSALDGRFYARCIPAKDEGGTGSTKIYRVESAKDVVIDSYDFYPPHGIWLGWSPKAGKVAVLNRLIEHNVDPKKQIELTCFLGGKKLASYTTEELWKMGAQKKLDMVGGNCAEISISGCEQIPGTNDYDFVIRTGLNTYLRIDILTGKIRAAKSKGGNENFKF